MSTTLQLSSCTYCSSVQGCLREMFCRAGNVWGAGKDAAFKPTASVGVFTGGRKSSWSTSMQKQTRTQKQVSKTEFHWTLAPSCNLRATTFYYKHTFHVQLARWNKTAEQVSLALGQITEGSMYKQSHLFKHNQVTSTICI